MRAAVADGRWARCWRLLFGLSLSIALWSPAGAARDIAYTVNGQESSLSIYDLTADGQPRYRRHLAVAKAPAALALHPNGKFLYAVAKTSDQLLGFEIAEGSGELRPLPGFPRSLRARSPFALAFHPSGRFLYVAARFSGVAVLRVDAARGSVEEIAGSPYPAQERTRSVAVHPSGRFVYATNAYSNSVSVYHVDADDGTLYPQPALTVSTGAQTSPVQGLPLQDMPASGGGVPYMIALHPSGRYAFVSNWAGASLSVFRIAERDGSLQLVGKPVTTELNPYVVAVHPSGDFVYAGAWGPQRMAGYRFDAGDGSLRPLPGSPYDIAGQAPVAVAFTDAAHMLVVNSWSNNLSRLRIAADGSLQVQATTQTRSGPFQLVLHHLAEPPAPDRLLLANGDSGRVALWHAGDAAPTAAGKLPAFSAASVDPSHSLLYLLARDRPVVGAYRLPVDGGDWRPSGELTPAERPLQLLADPHLGFLYVYDAAGDVTAWVREPATGEFHAERYSLHPGSGMGAWQLDASSRYLFVAGGEPARVQVFRYGDAWGPVMADMAQYGPPLPLDTAPAALLTDPSGNFLVLARRQPAGLSVVRNHFQSGLLDAPSQRQEPLPSPPVALAMPPQGDRLAVLTRQPSSLRLYTFDNLSGQVSLQQTLPLPREGSELRWGREALYVLIAGEIQVYVADASTGTMIPGPRLPVDFPVTTVELIP